jgi:hypothetical protein
VPLRNKDNSPEMDASKKTKVDETPANTMAIRKQNIEVKREKADTSSAIKKHESKLRLDSQGDITSANPEEPFRAAWVDSAYKTRGEKVTQSPRDPGGGYQRHHTIKITISGKKVLGIGQESTRKVP